MEITGDTNATLKDLTRIVEAEIMQAAEPLYPLICSEIESADEAYIKIPIQTKVPFPTLFDGEREPGATEVAVVQQYTKGTYALTLDFDSDLMRESKAYTFSEKTQEGTQSAVIFPSYNLTNNIVASSSLKAYDGTNFYSSTGHYWAGIKSSGNLINNSVTQSGTTVTALWTDMQKAVTAIRTFKDDKSRLLNPLARFGAGQFIIHSPVNLAVQFRQLLFGSMIPMAAPVTTSGTAAVGADGPKGFGLSGIATIYEDGYLDAINPNGWYLHYVGAPQRPFVFSESYGVTAKALGFGTEFETNTNKVRIALKHRFVEGAYRFDRSIKIS